jgi:hypothetical protein
MIVISDSDALARALTLPLDPRLASLLLTRQRQLGGEFHDHCRFVVFQPGDRPCWLEQALGFSIFDNAGDGTRYGDSGYSPGFEWIEDHGFCFELAFQFTDDFTHVVIVEKAPGVNGDVLEFCRAYARQHA